METYNGNAYRIEGSGQPTIIFVHGFGCAHDDWRFQLEGLSGEFTCVAVDNPGFGQSKPAHSPLIPSFAAAVNLLRVKLGSEQVILVGHSLGTKIVREAYRQHRHGVVGIVLVDGSLNIGDPAKQQQKRRDLFEGRTFEEYTERSFRMMFVEGSDPAISEPIIARAKTVPPDYARALTLEASAWDSTQGLTQLRELDVPVLVLQSSHYNIDLGRTPLKPGDKTALMIAAEKEIPNCEIKVIEGVGHFTMLEAPEVVNREIAAFARKISSAQAYAEKLSETA